MSVEDPPFQRPGFGRYRPALRLSCGNVDCSGGAAVGLERTLLPDNVAISTELSEALPPVDVDAEKMEQIFLNLIDNAAQAMPRGGEISISTSANNGSVEFAFRDTGVGIRPENMERIFEPLFSTKTKGIGLGLAIVRMLIEAHQGKIEVSSQVGEGSLFTVSLPAQRKKESS